MPAETLGPWVDERTRVLVTNMLFNRIILALCHGEDHVILAVLATLSELPDEPVNCDCFLSPTARVALAQTLVDQRLMRCGKRSDPALIRAAAQSGLLGSILENLQ